MGALMIQGVSSGVGKSLITTAIARAFHRRGIDTAPFKAQNIANNARVVDGGEIGAAQYMQALAACVEPDVRMNPVLIKPESAGRSEVVVLGKRNAELSRLPWHRRSDRLWTEIERAMIDLAAEHDVLLTRIPRQQGIECRQQGHEWSHAFHLAKCLYRVDDLFGQRDGLVSSVELADTGAWPV